MATYGPSGGFVPFTGFSPTLGQVDAIIPVQAGVVQFNGITQNDGNIARLLFNRGQRHVRRLMLALTGAAAGGTATENMTRIQAQPATFSPTDYGGLVPVETIVQISRPTTALDVANINAMLSRTPVPTYVVEPSGTTGGGKLGY